MEVPFFLARQPIVDEFKNIYMYEIFLRSKKSPDKYPKELPPYKAAFIVIDLLTTIGYPRIVGDKKAMINLSIQNSLNKSYIETLIPEKTVINFQKAYSELSPRQWELIDLRLQELKKNGFEFAFDFDLINDKNSRILTIKYADYIVINFKDLGKFKDPFLLKKKCIVTKIETAEQFGYAKKFGCDFFEGYYLGKPEPIKTNVNFIVLSTTILKVLSKIEQHADLKEIEELIKSDPALVAKILKFVNSSYFYLPVEITSLRQALAYLGMNNLKKHLLVLMMLDLAETLKIPLDLYQKALISAFLAEMLAEKLGIDKDIAFLGGLFYPADIVFKVDPAKLVVDLRLSHKILEGYLQDDPKLFCIFYVSKVLAFELEKDETFNHCLENLKLDLNTLNQLLQKATEKAGYFLV